MALRTIGIEIDDAIYRRAVSKAIRQRKTINQVLAELLSEYAGPAPAPVPTMSPAVSMSPPPASGVAASQSSYTVQAGDTLGLIARKVYGNARLYPLIQRANNIQDPRRIYVGQRLIIPAQAGTSTTTTTAVAPSQPPAQPATPTPTTPGIVTKNPRPPIRFVGSPNFNRRPHGEISAIVVHATANGSLQGVINWFNNPDAQASAHYTIGKDGAIVQHVQDEHRAWHAGVSSWNGRSNLNDWALGIELVNWNDGADPFPEAQHQANVFLISYLAERYKVNPVLIRAHYDVSPGRKTDPRGYDMERLRREVTARQ